METFFPRYNSSNNNSHKSMRPNDADDHDDDDDGQDDCKHIKSSSSWVILLLVKHENAGRKEIKGAKWTGRDINKAVSTRLISHKVLFLYYSATER